MIHVGGICQSIQFMHLSTGDRILIIIVMYHRNGMNHSTDGEVHLSALINNK
jgi:hypothetical protein